MAEVFEHKGIFTFVDKDGNEHVMKNPTDTSLSVEGMAADAKATGEGIEVALSAARTALQNIDSKSYDIEQNTDRIFALEQRIHNLNIIERHSLAGNGTTLTFENGVAELAYDMNYGVARKYDQIRGVIVNGFGGTDCFVATISDADPDSIRLTVRCVNDPNLSGDHQVSVIFFANDAKEA